jgi:hypothetical protein
LHEQNWLIKKVKMAKKSKNQNTHNVTEKIKWQTQIKIDWAKKLNS